MKFETYFINYILNKFCPIIVVALLCFNALDFKSFEPYVILLMMLFSQKFHQEEGYSLRYCESKGINLDD